MDERVDLAVDILFLLSTCAGGTLQVSTTAHDATHLHVNPANLA
jgi:hypothetical protein